MKADVDVRLIHDGEFWIARNDTIEARGCTLHELDENLAHAFRRSGDFPEATRITVFMGYDYDTIPTWLRQYHTHYFNRYIDLDL